MSTYTWAARTWTARHPLVHRPSGRLDVVGGKLVFQAALPPCPPFFRWNLIIEGVHSAARSFRRSLPLSTLTELSLVVPRGRYSVSGHWELTDFFGFIRLLPKKHWNTVWIVEPEPLPLTPPPPPAAKAGTGRPRRIGSRAGDPFDVRVYTPGDDLRRLHWPMYAHAGVLFVRTAEPSPPPSGHQFLVLDTEAASEEELDQRLSRLTTWLAKLDAQGTGWTLTIPAADLTLNRVAGPALAGLQPLPMAAPPQPSWPDAVTVVTGPKSQGATQLARQLAASKRRYRPVVMAWSEPLPAAHPWWKR